jgi:NADPH:quinone reductase-like Zn-dependent oxidoreductase
MAPAVAPPAAAGVNNTDINTRIAWYAKAVAAGTNARAAEGFAGAHNIDGGWSGARMTFPRIRGADCCGRIVAVGEGVEPGRIGERAIVRTMLRSYVDYRPFECWTFGSECDGAFARCTKARESYKVSCNCNWSDAELASTPCAFSTAEGMLDRASVGAERILVTDASGGVGSAVVQLCKRRRAGGGGLQSS